jgi:hypothetical protein
MLALPANKDVLLPIFTQLPSFDRSKIVTVCKLWHEQAVRCTAILEPGDNWEEHFLNGNYHAIARGDCLPDEVEDIAFEDLCVDDNVELCKLHCQIVPSYWDVRVAPYEHLAEEGHHKSLLWLVEKYGEALFDDADDTIFMALCNNNHYNIVANYIEYKYMTDPCGYVHHHYVDRLYDGMRNAGVLDYNLTAAIMIHLRDEDRCNIYSLAYQDRNYGIMCAIHDYLTRD